MSSSIVSKFIFSLLLFTSFLSSSCFTQFGPLSHEENKLLKDICGKQTQLDDEFEGLFFEDGSTQKYLTSISPRHIIVDPHSSFLNFTYQKEKCVNNVQSFKTKPLDAFKPFSKRERNAFYIGSCEDDVPRGFVVMEYQLPFPNTFSPVCLSSVRLYEDAVVQVFVTRHVTPKTVEYIYTRVSPVENYDELVTTSLATDYGGPVLDPLSLTKKTYVGHAFGNDDTSIHIVPIFNYLEKICDVTGVCVGLDADDYEKLQDAQIFSSLSFIDAPTNEPLEPNIHVSFSSDDSFSIEPMKELEENAEMIDLSELEIFEENEESSGKNEESTIFFETEEYEQKDEQKTVFMSVVPEVKIIENAPEEAVIVRAEPITAIIIPLPDHEILSTPSNHHSFPTSTELLIAFLILLSLFFYVCMCLHGCVDYKGKSVFWQPDTGRFPV